METCKSFTGFIASLENGCVCQGFVQRSRWQQVEAFKNNHSTVVLACRKQPADISVGKIAAKLPHLYRSPQDHHRAIFTEAQLSLGLLFTRLNKEKPFTLVTDSNLSGSRHRCQVRLEGAASVCDGVAMFYWRQLFTCRQRPNGVTRLVHSV